MRRKAFIAKIITSALVLCALFALAAQAAALSDISGHWAEEYISYGVEKGYINGYSDGTFKPDVNVTRAEFSKMINSSLGITKTAENPFFDVEETDWFYTDVKKAVYAGYISGYENGAFIATNYITRQEAAAILSRIATRAETTKSLSSVSDEGEIADWAKDYMIFVFSKGYMTGDENKNLNPKGNLTRGQAAKLIYMLSTEENVYNGDYKVSLDNALLSETIFTDDVIFESGRENASLTLDGCRVLGTLKTDAKSKAGVKIKDSTVSDAIISGQGAEFELQNGATVSFLTVKSPSKIKGEGYGTVYLASGDLVSDATVIDASPRSVKVMTDAVIKVKDMETLEITNPVALVIQSGAIKNMSVGSLAKNSIITLGDGVDVTNLTVYAPSAFRGNGKIQKATEKASGVTYTKRPETMGEGSEGETEEKGTFAATSTSPSKNATNVAVSADIMITFPKAIYAKNGGDLTARELEDCIELRRSSSSGTRIAFEARVVGGKSVAITPDVDLSYDTAYYVRIKEGSVFDSAGNTNSEVEFMFETAEEEKKSVTFSPKKAAESVETGTEIKITFSDAVKLKDGGTLTNASVKDAITLRESSTSGNKVAFTASVNTAKKVITLTPEEKLKPNTKYYVTILSNKLAYSNGTSVTSENSYFTTADTLDIATVKPYNNATGVSPEDMIELVFNAEIFRPSGSNITTSYLAENAIELRKSYSSGTKVDFSAVITSDRKTVKIIPDELEAGTKYYVIVLADKIANKNGTTNKKFTSAFTTAAVMAPAIAPASGTEDVSTDTEITVKFTEEVFASNKKEALTEDYLRDKVITFKKGTSYSSATVKYNIKISGDGKTIRIIPVSPLSSNSTYYVSIASSTLYNASGKGNTSASSTFKTGLSGAPDFLPYNKETDVDIGTSIQITFDRKMYAIGGDELSTTYIKNNVVELHKEDADGALVSFSVSLSTDKQTITLKPSSKLEGNTTYFVMIRKSSIEDASGNENAMHFAAFTTAETVSRNSTITPENNAKGVTCSPTVKIEFASAVYRSGGTEATGAFIANNVAELRKGSTSGNKVECEAEISADNKTITLTPKKSLEPNTKYYVVIISNSLEYSDGTGISSKSSYFTTNNGAPEILDFKAETTASTAKFEVSSDTDGFVYVTLTEGDEKIEKGPEEIKAGEIKQIEVTKLASNTAYTASAYVKNADGLSSSAKVISVKTLKPFDAEVDEITETGAVLTINTYCDGSAKIVYRNSDTNEFFTKATDLSLKATTTKTFEFEDLEPDTNYDIIIEFTDEKDALTTETKKIKTEKTETAALEILGITVTTDTGDEYSPKFAKNGVAEITVDNVKSIYLTGESSVKDSYFEFDGKKTSPGQKSSKIELDENETKEISIILSSNGTSEKISRTLKVTIGG
ncbi:MAG: Ig-like domain-containing protein [Clostridiales bacterium]|nr:Ig-like domain-containing protein [Clostridiales bacterium]